GSHHGNKVIWVKFDYDKNLIQHLRSYAKVLWSASQKAWYMTDNSTHRNLCGLEPELVGKEVLLKISEINLPEFQKFQNILILKAYSVNTRRTYSIEFAQLLYVLKNFPVQELSKERLQSYFLYCHKELQLSENQIHSRINAIKFYYEQVLHQSKMFFDIPRPKKPVLLPKPLNVNEVKRLFSVTENLKHRLILQLCYGMGLRVSEIVNLKISDIDSLDMKVRIERGKGKKDRFVNLPNVVLEDLRKYYKEHLPKVFLFEGQQGTQYSVRSAQLVFKEAMKKAKINKKIGIHGLRHSYATHLIELGTDITFIQKLMGHNDIKTTQVYTHVTDMSITKIGSPLDRIIE
ncbi:MAG: tyrosine-type recombinase/integrase, partial [Bacteroidetes bacterium]|nr:tyrosine-type recombinase/integrase [Bacteroidota bacterium]